MAKNPEIEEIFDAWWDLFHCVPSDRARAEKRLNDLVDKVVARSNSVVTRDQILNHLWPQYRDDYRVRRTKESVQIQQSSLGE
jgi:hypothetical protein